MRKFFTAICVFAVFASSAFCKINLKLEDSIKNQSPGYCAWCCIESLGRHHKIKSLYGLMEKRTKESDFVVWDEKKKKWVDEPYVLIDYGDKKVRVERNVGDYVAMKQKLDEAKVKYTIQEYGIHKKDIIHYAVDKNLGCMIVVRWWKDNSGGTHAIIIEDCNDEKITFFDPNDLEHKYTASWAWLDQYWTGYTLVIEGEK